jgi:hypothetical protein
LSEYLGLSTHAILDELLASCILATVVLGYDSLIMPPFNVCIPHDIAQLAMNKILKYMKGNFL